MSRTFRKKIYGTLGEMLKSLREERGILAADIALHADLSIATINELENGCAKDYGKYKCLFRFYGKTFDIVLKDLK